MGCGDGLGEGTRAKVKSSTKYKFRGIYFLHFVSVEFAYLRRLLFFVRYP